VRYHTAGNPITTIPSGTGRIMLLRTSVAVFAAAISLGLWSPLMKKLVAAIAVLCLSSSVLAHDIYTDLHDRNGSLCCGRQDCMPVKALARPDGSYFLPSTGETIPADMAMPSPDNRFHQCFYFPTGYEWERPKTRCFFAPMHSF
jgi:hypothetical protein